MQKIGYEFYCEEHFIVKHKSRYSCESMIYFYLDVETIKENCKFTFYYNKTDITPTVLDGMEEMKLSWLIGQRIKYIMYNINDDTPVRIPSHPYI